MWVFGSEEDSGNFLRLMDPDIFETREFEETGHNKNVQFSPNETGTHNKNVPFG